ncbi:hypothetical protein EHI8A_093770 [Entamoeba histolytica HM-1:IMSS-B]|uniref:Uncharacterized protein n=2 Tax=Entamoeba histolytica (strain ATCC 30459 / HM-1:IMSS / ABRM) TaxID=294381 RepID=M3SBI5_ENTH1|nr:hypothetical protein EHI8A_093770 [Entamoeba histolytica HM-1:IMSS-B]ENY65794.1 unknown protein, putative [Entamoeba histolytica HM-1:IMSS-A]
MLHIDFVSMDIFLNKINILEQQKGYKIYEQVTLKRDLDNEVLNEENKNDECLEYINIPINYPKEKEKEENISFKIILINMIFIDGKK